MKKTSSQQPYSLGEELFNSISHGIGVVFGIVALVLMILKSSEYSDNRYLASALIFGISIIVLYLNSTLYHSFPWARVKHLFKILDHISIYFLIAGTYTPFMLITLKGVWGYTIISIIWGLSILGLIFKLFFVGRFNKLSTLLYVLMGWTAIFAIKPLMQALPTGGVWLVISGGIVYTVGAVFYLWKKLPFNHGIWHLFVLGGTVLHFIAVYVYVF
ncbi:MAG: hemolysin III family protein [Calditrichia bacterium]